MSLDNQSDLSASVAADAVIEIAPPRIVALPADPIMIVAMSREVL